MTITAELRVDGARFADTGADLTAGTDRPPTSGESNSVLLTPTDAPPAPSEVPTGEPITFLSATEVVSWHMLELSGRLLWP